MNNIEKEQARLSDYYVYDEHHETWKFWNQIFDSNTTDAGEAKRIACGNLFKTTILEWKSKKQQNEYEKIFGKDKTDAIDDVVVKFEQKLVNFFGTV